MGLAGHNCGGGIPVCSLVQRLGSLRMGRDCFVRLAGLGLLDQPGTENAFNERGHGSPVGGRGLLQAGFQVVSHPEGQSRGLCHLTQSHTICLTVVQTLCVDVSD